MMIMIKNNEVGAPNLEILSRTIGDNIIPLYL